MSEEVEILKEVVTELKAMHKTLDYQLRRMATRIEEINK